MKTYLSLAEKLTLESEVEAAIERRTTSIISPQVVYLPVGGLGKEFTLFKPGTITAIISITPSAYLSGLAAALKKEDKELIRLNSEAITERGRKDTLQRLVTEGLEDIPFIVDIRYGNSWIAKHILLASHTQIAMSAAVWSGGQLNDDAFRVLEHGIIKANSAGIEVLIVLTPPQLSKIEQAVLKAAPKELSDIHIKGPSVAWSAAGIYSRHTKSGSEGSSTDIEKLFMPFRDVEYDRETRHQAQQQQDDTKQQQQQQQIYNQDGQMHQQQQQQQQQNDHQQQQQQVEQQQDNHNNQQQQQQQQQQQNQTEQQQDIHEHEHQANTEQGTSHFAWWRDELNGGLVTTPADEGAYLSLLSQIDFSKLDATQSVIELLTLRERLVAAGLG